MKMAAAKSGSRERGGGEAPQPRSRGPAARRNTRRGDAVAPEAPCFKKGNKNSRLRAPLSLQRGSVRHVKAPHPPPPVKGNGAGRPRVGKLVCTLRPPVKTPFINLKPHCY